MRLDFSQEEDLEDRIAQAFAYLIIEQGDGPDEPEVTMDRPVMIDLETDREIFIDHYVRSMGWDREWLTEEGLAAEAGVIYDAWDKLKSEAGAMTALDWINAVQLVATGIPGQFGRWVAKAFASRGLRLLRSFGIDEDTIGECWDRTDRWLRGFGDKFATAGESEAEGMAWEDSPDGPKIRYNKAENEGGGHQDRAGMSDKRPPLWDDHPDFEGWKIKDPKDADKVMRHDHFGKFYRDPDQKLGNKRLWWSKDQAGHGGSKYKLFVERSN